MIKKSWKSILDANGGTSTKPGSIFDKLGLKVNIHIVNDATQSSNALIKGDLNASGYTINRAAFLSKKFKNADVDVVMPYITNYSNGGDGIIATEDFKSVESLVNAKIGVPQFSEAHSLVIWFVNQSDLSDADKKNIINNLILFNTPDEAAKAFFAGEIDAAATWQPYLSQAESTTDCHVLFSTTSSSKLIMDGILFRDDFAKAHPETVQKFIDGSLQAMDMYGNEFDTIREVMPMFAGLTDEEIKKATEDAALADWKRNMNILKDDAPTIYTNMCGVWKSIREDVDEDMVNTLFNAVYMEALAPAYETMTSTEETTAKVTAENKEEIINTEALMKKSATVNFKPDTAKFLDTKEASKALNEFIKIAQSLDGAIIQIEGNIASDNPTEAGRKLSEQRATTVKKYFIANGIDPDRIISIGNGAEKPLAKNDTEEHKAMNRRTDFYFKIIEQ